MLRLATHSDGAIPARNAFIHHLEIHGYPPNYLQRLRKFMFSPHARVSQVAASANTRWLTLGYHLAFSKRSLQRALQAFAVEPFWSNVWRDSGSSRSPPSIRVAWANHYPQIAHCVRTDGLSNMVGWLGAEEARESKVAPQ